MSFPVSSVTVWFRRSPLTCALRSDSSLLRHRAPPSDSAPKSSPLLAVRKSLCPLVVSVLLRTSVFFYSSPGFRAVTGRRESSVSSPLFSGAPLSARLLRTDFPSSMQVWPQLHSVGGDTENVWIDLLRGCPGGEVSRKECDSSNK